MSEPQISNLRLKNSRRRGSAFTLLELMLSLAMVAMISVPLYQTLRIAYKAKADAEASITPSRTVELAMEFLRMDIECAMPPSPNSPGYATTSTSTTATPAASTTTSTAIALAGAFIGAKAKDDRGHDGDDLVFYTTSDGPAHPPGPDVANGDGEIKMVELTVVTGNGTSDHWLVRRVTRNLLSQQQVTPEDEILCRHVGSFSVGYYDGSAWQDSWDSTQQNNELPVAVQVTMSLDAANGDPNQATARFIRVFPVVCSTLIADNNSSTSTTGTTGITGSTGTTGTKTGGKTP